MSNPPPHRLKSHLQLLYASGRNALLSMLFPWPCVGCALLQPFPRVICDSCQTGLKRIVTPFCKKCGAPLPAHWRVGICPECRAHKSPLTRIRSAFEYDGTVRQMIRDAKYSDRPRVLRFFAEQLLPLSLSEFPRQIEALVPVPLHPQREWERHFNQAEMIAEDLSQYSGIVVWNALRKVKRTMPQSLLAGPARRHNLRGAFETVTTTIVPRSVLLIDDVITTGATLEECARMLRRSGVQRVYALTIARAVLKG